MGKYAIEADHVSMRFNINKEGVDNAKEYFIRLVKHDLHYVEFWALKDVSFKLKKGDRMGVLGFNGAGKSTLLNLLGGLDSPTEGTITVGGRDISTLSDNELADYRAATVGFVFQFYNLIPTLTVYENVELVSSIAPNALDAKQMIGEVGLSDHLHNFPSELSGGEQQRVSIARALAKNQKLLL